MFKMSRYLLLFLLLLFVSSTASAQIDTEGWSRAEELEKLFLADEKEKFRELFEQDEALSRRGYLAAMELALKALHEGDDSAGERCFVVAQLLAYGMEQSKQESTPRDILKAFEGNDPQAILKFLDFADSHYPGYREALASEVAWLAGDVAKAPPRKEASPAADSDYSIPILDPSTVSEEYFDVIRPFLVKLQRIDFAGMFDDRQLVLQELETFPQVEKETLARAESAGLAERFRKDFAFVGPDMELARMRLLAESGLLGEFDDRIPEMLAGPGSQAGKLSLLYTAYRVALRTQSWQRADGYLEQMAALMRGGESSPVFQYLYGTGKFQLEVAQGANPTAEELLERFYTTWDTLASYRPMRRVEEDVHFHLVRESTRFWLNELTALEPSQNVNAILRVNEDCAAWLDNVSDIDSLLGDLDDHEILFYSPQMEGYLTSVLCSLDIIMYIIETWKPMLDDGENFAEVVRPFPERIEDIAGSATEMTPYLEKGPAFPQFDLGQAFLLAEMRARSRYLLALDPANTPEQKLAYLREAAGLVDKLDQPESYIDYQLVIGKQFSQVGLSDEAVSAWSKAYDLATERRFVRRSLEAAVLLGTEWGRMEQWDKAGAIAQEASRTLEEELDSSSGMTETSQALAQIRTRAAVETDDPQAALAALNENKQVQEAALRLRGEGEGARATRDLQSKRKTLALLTRRVQELEERPQSETRDELLEKAQNLLAESKSDFLLESRKLRSKFSKLYTTALRFDPLNLPDIQSVLPESTAVVQYFPTDEDLYIFVVSGDKFRLRSVSYPKQKLDQQVLAYLGRLRALQPNDKALGQLSRDLHSALIGPISEDIEGAQTLVLIPAGKLNLLPFGSLQGVDGRYLLDEKTLLELAKPTDFLRIATHQAQPLGRIVVFANATLDLPSAEMEGRNIQELFPESELYTGAEASRDNLMKFGQQADVLHLATHGVWDAEDSLKNHLELANNEQLAQEEIFELSLDSSIVTLSACSTALGEQKDVEYVASLAEAFWIAGSRSVVASLWQVDDQSTSLLMTRFYSELKNGKPKGEALREAQLAVKSDSRYAHPYFWSGFLLFGDYR